MNLAASAFEQRDAAKGRGKLRNFFAVHAGGAVFGLPVDAVQTIFRVQSITPVPLGPPVICGLVNLRGKIVTAVSLQKRLGLSGGDAGATPGFAVAVESRGETFALVVDSVGDARECSDSDRIPPPRHVTEDRAALTESYYRIEDGILPVLDIDALFDLKPPWRAMPEVTAQRDSALTGARP